MGWHVERSFPCTGGKGGRFQKTACFWCNLKGEICHSWGILSALPGGVEKVGQLTSLQGLWRDIAGPKSGRPEKSGTDINPSDDVGSEMLESALAMRK